ncbi:WLM-domain-containing protein [Macrolepiota fuliginosa MF-IS2]|uniref:WLM-domain-containing protein n=1 Tax=Macrolepiota fuliginosa MF-IS2 TaxID=1400762 RepID=A0A9P6C605_9AGAR|nr:WLM-domain-containing protein [Macrolepiota fuliginosa MF-IS2]
MVHLRLNDTEPNPNPHINFIKALPMLNSQDQEEARQLLRALAAQVRPVMKAHGFAVNSLEEYQYNTVFAGRNWSNGETIELVLRRANGSYCPASWLMSTLCHELAHIKHMNHGPTFQALWTQLRREVRQLQDKGYYGDGYWSSGTRLADSMRVSGDGLDLGELPEYMCGGAQTRSRPTSLRRRRRGPQDTVPSLHTGRQTAKRRKAGSRVTSKFAFVGEGKSLGHDAESSKGKRAVSNRAREERALAAEKRLSALAQTKGTLGGYEISESEDEIEFVQETDAERRQLLLDSKESGNTEDDCALGKGLLWKYFDTEFRFNTTQQKDGEIPSGHLYTPKPQLNVLDVIDLTDSPDMANDPCDIPIASGSTFVSSVKESSKGKQKEVYRSTSNQSSIPRLDKSPQKSAPRNLVKSETELRKKEALGLAQMKGGDRTLGKAPKGNNSRRPDLATNKLSKTPEATEPIKPSPSTTKAWNCLVCTLENEPDHLACAACATPRGEDTYHLK